MGADQCTLVLDTQFPTTSQWLTLLPPTPHAHSDEYDGLEGFIGRI
jgi:hypothetical protein